MKRIYILIPIVIASLSVAFTACDESEFLKEDALSFYSQDNSFVNTADFERSVTAMYSQVRANLWGDTYGGSPYFVSTDIAKDGRLQLNSTRFGGHSVYLVPTNSTVKRIWDDWYKLISYANTVIDRVDKSSMPDSDKTRFAAEGKLMRGFAYRFLVYLYGGVPLVLNEVTSPKTDYVRASKEEVLRQMVNDFSDASAGLPDIASAGDGRVSNLVAYHYLAETYVSLGEYQKAIDAATIVINDPNTALMQNRFGSMANTKPYDPYLDFTQDGDVFWDLFRVGNQNRSSGNKEALWVCEFEVDVEGGLLTTNGSTALNGVGQNLMERNCIPSGTWGGFIDPDGVQGEITLAQSNYNCGGAGVSLMQNTDWWLNDLWKSDWDNDIRNAPHNIVRDHVYTNPKSAYYKKSLLKYPSKTWTQQRWRWYPYPTKCCTPGQHPDALYRDKSLATLNGGGQLYRDMYNLRLAETYLLRAEAYLAAGDAQKAADDVNAVRERAKAKPISASDVTLDYILDERARELVYEEPRRITLHRTGKLVERVRKYNELNSSEIQDIHGLWPIPNSFIEANVSAKIEQNPGY